jgi:hypothetical protein
MKNLKFVGESVKDKSIVEGYFVQDQDGACYIVNNYGTSYTWDQVIPESVKCAADTEVEKITTPNTPSPQLLCLVAILKASATVSTTAVLKVLYNEFPQLRAVRSPLASINFAL